nr:hypothetical protein KPHV_40720 [Kitasatospora purpeofusca]
MGERRQGALTTCHRGVCGTPRLLPSLERSDFPGSPRVPRLPGALLALPSLERKPFQWWFGVWTVDPDLP